MKVWLEILQFRPMTAFRLDLDERADARSGADAAAVQVDEVGMMDDDVLFEHDTCGNHRLESFFRKSCAI